MKRSSIIAALAFTVAAAPVALRAENNASGSKSATKSAAAATLTPEATQVLVDIHRTNLAEIEMGKLAKSNGQSDAVKKFGDDLVNDHQAADKKVSDLAKQANVALPDKDALMAGHEKQMKADLENKKGAAFDAAFAQHMAMGHQDAINRLEQAQPKLTGPTAQLVTELLPQLRKHLQTAQQLASARPASSGSSATGTTPR